MRSQTIPAKQWTAGHWNWLTRTHSNPSSPQTAKYQCRKYYWEIKRLTRRDINVFVICSPCLKSMIKTPSTCWCTDTVLHLQCVAGLEERRIRADVRLQVLPIEEHEPYLCFRKLPLWSKTKYWNSHVLATSSKCETSPIPNNSFNACFSELLPKVKTLSTCAMTASTSAEQFFGMFWRIGSKYPQ